MPIALRCESDCSREAAVGTRRRAPRCQQSPESLDKSRFYLSPDPPKSPLRRGVGVDFDPFPVPPFLRGARGDLGLIVKQHSVTGFDVKLTPMGSAVSLNKLRLIDSMCAIDRI